MITNSDLFFEINSKFKKNISLKKNPNKIIKKAIKERKEIFNKFLKISISALNYKIDQKTYAAVAGSYINYFIEFFVYYYFFSSEINIKKEKLKLNFNIKHDFEYFYALSQDKEFILEVLNFIKFEKINYIFKKNGNLDDLNFFNQNFLIKNKNIKKKKIIEILFHETRHKKNLEQLKNKKIIILDKKKIDDYKLTILNKNRVLRYNFINQFSAKNTLEKKFLAFFYNYFSTFYLESILTNLGCLNNEINHFPKIIMSDAHAWFMNDKFRHYLGLQSWRGSKIINFQINGATNLTYHNPHIQVASKFSDKMTFWIDKSFNHNKKNVCIPSMYFVNIPSNKLKSKSNNFEIIYFGCGLTKYFKGFWSSYISGGYIREYIKYSFSFLSNLKKKNLKYLKFRLRIENLFEIENKKKKI